MDTKEGIEDQDPNTQAPSTKDACEGNGNAPRSPETSTRQAEDGTDDQNEGEDSAIPNAAPNTVKASIPDPQTDSPVVLGDDGKPLSKNQLKKRRRYEKAMEIKKRRKQQEKDAKRAKAIAAGRDLDEERRLQEERTKSGEGHKRREQFWLERMKAAETSFKVCIDCSYESEMTPKEINSLALQIRYSYAANKRSKNPCYLSVSSLSGATLQNLNKVAGFPDQWKSRAFECSEKSLVDMHKDKGSIVYLTSDSPNTLDHLDDSKIYVIGGIVDRNRLKRATINRAKELGIETANLPISSYLKLVATKVLTCNHVFEILLKYREYGNDWKKAMLDVLPERKDMEPIEGEQRK